MQLWIFQCVILQVRKAPKSSNEAKLVKLADKLYNLRDLSSPNGRPKHWDDERVREYFKWSRRVVTGLKGTNQDLETKIFELCDKGEVMWTFYLMNYEIYSDFVCEWQEEDYFCLMWLWLN